MGRALQILTDQVEGEFRDSLDMLVRVIDAIDWRSSLASEPGFHVHLYEQFLQEYDADLRKDVVRGAARVGRSRMSMLGRSAIRNDRALARSSGEKAARMEFFTASRTGGKLMRAGSMPAITAVFAIRVRSA
nr:hypothetical protein OG999_22915 [Streptomyces sp. NBC_00886]